MIESHWMTQKQFPLLFVLGINRAFLDELRFVEKLEALEDTFGIPGSTSQTKSDIDPLPQRMAIRRTRQ